MRQRFGEAVWIDLLEPSAFRRFEARPERLSEHLEACPAAGPVVIDEIQRVPALLPVVHSLIESRPGLQYILTGSSARKLRPTGVDLLGGRAAVRRMHPFMAVELDDAFVLSDSLRLGMVPVVRFAKSPEDALAGYTDVYLRQ